MIMEPLPLISDSLNTCFYITAFFVIVNYMDNSTLYCTSENLFESLQKATAFCVITGETTIITNDIPCHLYRDCFHYCRGCLLLLSPSACCVLVLSRAVLILVFRIIRKVS